MSGNQPMEALAGRHARKRPHHEVEGSDSNDRSEPSWLQRPSSSSHAFTSANSPFNLAPLRQTRLPGYDYRRPIMSTHVASRASPLPSSPPPQAAQQANVIDLTEEPDQVSAQPSGRTPRAPRFGRDIMADNVVDLEAGSQSSPEVQFMGATAVPQSRQLPRPVEPQAQGGGPRSNSGMFQRSRSRNWLFSQQPRSERSLRQAMRLGMIHMGPYWIGQQLQGSGMGEMDLTVDLDQNSPVHLDYTSTTTQTPQPTAPAYVPPSAADEGFTRTPNENEIAVCPNCDIQLGTGEEPVMREIWVSKPCGHVYCGTCTRNRAVTRGKKQSPRPPTATKPFSKCVVPDCQMRVSQPKSMIQLYL